MVRYHLGTNVRKENKKFSIPFIEDSKISDSLNTIDNFTMKFLNEQALIKYLIEHNIYTKGEDKKIYVVYTYNKSDKKLPALYSDSKKYMSTEYLRYTLKQLAGDIVFLEKLANHFDIGKSNFNPQKINVQVLRGYVNEVRFSSTKEPFYSQRVYDTLEDIFLKAIINKINKQTGEVDINYRGLRDLALFVKKYVDSLIIKEIKDNSEEIRRFEYNENYDEPSFPPNSEEEDMYLEYLENLQDEEPDYISSKHKTR